LSQLDTGLLWLILACATATYITRIAGHLLLARFKSVHFRVESALNAVPVAVLTALIAPSVLTVGLPEFLAMLVAGVAGWRLPMFWTLAIGLVALVLARQLI